MKADLNELLERVRSATGPDRELDLVVWNAVNKHPSEWHPSFPTQSVVTYKKYGEDAVGNPVYELDALTASIDAAIALVERVLPGWVVADLCQNSRHAGDPWGCTLAVYYGSTPSKNRSAQSGYDFPTAPLAILAALISALIAQEPK